jgi:hypothetical protein
MKISRGGLFWFNRIGMKYRTIVQLPHRLPLEMCGSPDRDIVPGDTPLLRVFGWVE